MKNKAWMLDGRLIHVGEEWPHDFRKLPMPCLDDPAAILEKEVDFSPIPDGAQLVDVELATTAHGDVVLASDYAILRKHEYPTLADQLDAFWKGGDAAETMRQAVLAVKAKYPKV